MLGHQKSAAAADPHRMQGEKAGMTKEGGDGFLPAQE
jgi:hypothetical protein